MTALITHSDVDEIERAFEAKRLLRAAVEWFDLNKPQWGPGTLPTWYVDAKSKALD